MPSNAQVYTLRANPPCVYVDFAGDGGLRQTIHTNVWQLVYSCSIGGARVNDLVGARSLPGPKATLFFAPTQAKKRGGEWGGAAEFNRRLVAAWRDFLVRVQDSARPSLVVQTHDTATAAACAQVLGGHGDARISHELSLSRPG